MPASKEPLLLVDDDPDIREALRDTVADEGYEVIEATNGQEALDYLRANHAPPLVLLDWNMSPVNGLQFMAETAKDPTLAKIPVVLLTADARAPEKSNAHGFAGYLVKPVNLDTLFAIIGRYCG
jgi:CheY-like chemotaxis protein